MWPDKKEDLIKKSGTTNHTRVAFSGEKRNKRRVKEKRHWRNKDRELRGCKEKREIV